MDISLELWQSLSPHPTPPASWTQHVEWCAQKNYLVLKPIRNWPVHPNHTDTLRIYWSATQAILAFIILEKKKKTLPHWLDPIVQFRLHNISLMPVCTGIFLTSPWQVEIQNEFTRAKLWPKSNHPKFGFIQNSKWMKMLAASFLPQHIIITPGIWI